MANSNLLKEAIADAKAVRETAIANAKIALEEAFTPRLQSILSQKLQQEIEEGEEEEEKVEETADVNEEEEVNEEYDKDDAPDGGASDIGDGDNKQPADDANSSSDVAKGNPDTEVETAAVGSEEDETEVVKEGEEDEDSVEEVTEGEEEEEVSEEGYGHSEEEDIDEELDLESIIKELEADLAEDSHEEEADAQEELDAEEKEEVEDIADDAVDSHEEERHEETVSEEESEEEDLDEEIDLNEILKEMGYGEDEDESEEEVSEEVVEETNELEETKAELEEAMSTIKELKSTINEVNLLNAKLLYTNKLFRSYDLTNDQKMKVVETLDRTGNVREVKLVFSTLAESFKFNGTAKKQKASKINESFASKPVASTAPSKEVITESTNEIAERFKKLANIK